MTNREKLIQIHRLTGFTWFKLSELIDIPETTIISYKHPTTSKSFRNMPDHRLNSLLDHEAINNKIGPPQVKIIRES